MNKEALQQVIRVLKNVEDRDLPFLMDQWMQPFYRDRFFWRQRCGTAGCAIGYAANDPWFIARGLRLIPWTGGKVHLGYQELFNWDACREFFDLSLYDSMFLFSVRSYVGKGAPTPTEVAIRIQAFIGVSEEVKGDVKEVCGV